MNSTRIANLLAELPEADRAKASEHIARAELALERQRLLGILAPYIRQWIKEEVGLLVNQTHGKHQCLINPSHIRKLGPQ